MKSILICLTFLWIYISTSSAINLGYYWKDFDGTIPEDAFVGYDDSVSPLYVGMGYSKGAGLIPSTIYAHLPNITITAGGTITILAKNIMILCTQNPIALNWVPVHYDDIATIQKIKFLKIVEAGTETNAPLYVGRTFHEGAMQIGKIYNAGEARGLDLPNKRGGGTDYKNFEILIYCLI